MNRKQINFIGAGLLIGFFFGLYTDYLWLGLGVGLALGLIVGFVLRKD